PERMRAMGACTAYARTSLHAPELSTHPSIKLNNCRLRAPRRDGGRHEPSKVRVRHHRSTKTAGNCFYTTSAASCPTFDRRFTTLTGQSVHLANAKRRHRSSTGE